jgi:hypothetical protein
LEDFGNRYRLGNPLLGLRGGSGSLKKIQPQSQRRMVFGARSYGHLVCYQHSGVPKSSQKFGAARLQQDLREGNASVHFFKIANQ